MRQVLSGKGKFSSPSGALLAGLIQIKEPNINSRDMVGRCLF
jgi:hypothetical protein